MIIPKLGCDYFVIVKCKASTGQILNLEGALYLEGDDFYESVLGLKAAENRAEFLMENELNIEVSIHDGNGEFVKIYREVI